MDMSTDMLEGLSVSIYTFLEIFILGKVKLKNYILSEDGAPWTIMPIMRHHGHVTCPWCPVVWPLYLVHGAMVHFAKKTDVHGTPMSMVPRSPSLLRKRLWQ